MATEQGRGKAISGVARLCVRGRFCAWSRRHVVASGCKVLSDLMQTNRLHAVF